MIKWFITLIAVAVIAMCVGCGSGTIPGKYAGYLGFYDGTKYGVTIDGFTDSYIEGTFKDNTGSVPFYMDNLPEKDYYSKGYEDNDGDGIKTYHYRRFVTITISDNKTIHLHFYPDQQYQNTLIRLQVLDDDNNVIGDENLSLMLR